MGRTPGLAVFAPASLPDEEEVIKGLKELKTWGIEAKNLVFSLPRTPGDLAKEVFKLFCQRDLTYLWAARGGFGCLKLLPYLDKLFETKGPLPSGPVIVGYSDITVLQLYLYFKAGWISISAPNLVELPRLSEEEKEAFKRLLLREIDKIELKGEPLEEGEAEGVVLGGNLISLASLCGTPFFAFREGIILCIEEVKEEAYRIERALLQVIFSAGKEKIKGIIFGNLDKVSGKEVYKRVREYLPGGIPVGSGFPFGHKGKRLPFMIGRKARLICEKKAIFVQEV
jgi:muramoyltetrapeptide carboxypeptidase